jgi:phthalate 4,5-cis-dihydrodiol dehydrogenase
VAAADPRVEARERFAQEFHGRTYSSAAALCADSDLDVVYVASPHEFHASHAIMAAQSGKHVLVEKPMATSVADCKAMAEAARLSGTKIIIGPSHSFDAPVKLAADLIAKGSYGRPRMITALNFTDYLYRPRRLEEFNALLGGGVVFAQAVHQIDVVRRLAGSTILSVRAQTGDWDPKRSTDGAYAAFLTFESGAVATLSYSGYAHYDSDELCGWISETGYPKSAESYGEARRKLAESAGMSEDIRKARRAYGVMNTGTDRIAPPFHEHFGFVIVSCDHADLSLKSDGVIVYGDKERQAYLLNAPLIPRMEVIDELVEVVLGGAPGLHTAEWGTATIACCAALRQSSEERREIFLGM